MFHVHWIPSALNDLAEIWSRANDRQAVTEATQRIDDMLSRDPGSQGESRDEGRRILLESPLGVLFRVDATARTVSVLSAWRFAGPRDAP
jgi:hypothetical protein